MVFKLILAVMLGLFRIGIFVFLFFIICPVYGQQAKYQKILSFSYETGPMLSNGTEWGDQIKHAMDYKAIDLQIGWRKVSMTKFNHLYRYPTLGVGFNSTIPYTPEIGRPQVIYGFMDIPFSIAAQPNRISFGYFLHMGVGFNLKPFHPDINPINQYIGSKVNCYMQVGLTSTVRLSERVDFQTSLGFKHFSNGATKRPNAGINLFPLNVGINVKLGDLISLPEGKPVFEENDGHSFWNFALYTGMRNYEIGAPSYFRGGLGFNYLIEPSLKYRLGIGMDFFWAQGMHLRFPEQNFTFQDQTSLAVVGSWEWQLTERIFVPIAFGTYLYRNELNEETTWFYQRIGARYRFDNNMSVGMQIKAHKAKADFFEFTLGYTLEGKK